MTLANAAETTKLTQVWLRRVMFTISIGLRQTTLQCVCSMFARAQDQEPEEHLQDSISCVFSDG